MHQNKCNILILTYWPYSDPLVQTATMPYIRQIKELESIGSILLFCLSSNQNKDINLIDSQNNLLKWDKSIELLIEGKYYKNKFLMMYKWVKYLFILFRLIQKNKITHIHCFCTPAGVFGYILSKFTNIILIVDSFEPHADSMVENKLWSPISLKYLFLFKFEILLTKKARFLISCSPNMNEYVINRYKLNINDKILYRPSCVDVDIFNSKNYPKLKNEYFKSTDIICVYAGKFGGFYLEDEIFIFLRCAYNFWGNSFKFILLSNVDASYILKKFSQFEIPIDLLFKYFVNHSDVPFYLAQADFAIAPIRNVPSKLYCSPIKCSEYFSMGLPVIISNNISIDSSVIECNHFGYVIREWKVEKINDAIKFMSNYIKSSNYLLCRSDIASYARQHRNFSTYSKVYQEIYLF